jgi:hypothetical protein
MSRTDISYLKKIKKIDNDCYEIITIIIKDTRHSRNISDDPCEMINDITYPITDITVIKPPLYYLFDGFLNENIGSSNEKTMKLFHYLSMHKSTNIKQENLVDINNPTHATRFYKIDIDTETGSDNRYYLIYSNSGLGIENHIIELNSLNSTNVYPKIFVSNNKKNRDLLIQLIILIYNLFFGNYIDTYDLQYVFADYRLNDNKNNYIITKINDEYISVEVSKILELLSIENSNLTDIFKFDEKLYTDIYAFVKEIKSTSKSAQLIIYAIIYYCMNKLNNNEYDINECTFNHIIKGNDPQGISNIFKKFYNQSTSNTIKDFYNNTNNYNQIIINELYQYQLSDDVYREQNFMRIHSIVNIINEELTKYGKIDKTIEHKLKNFKIKYDYKFGISINAQKSGSCTFYSYYNLGILNLLYTLSKNSDTEEIVAEKFVNKFLYIHYKFINLFIYDLKTRYLKEYKHYYSHYNFIYKLIIDNNLYDVLIINNKFYMDKYGNINNLIDSRFTIKCNLKKSIIRETNNVAQYKLLKKYIFSILEQIRKSDKKLSEEVIKTDTKNFIYRHLEILNFKFKDINILVDVYVIIFLILKRVYDKKNNNENYPINYIESNLAHREKIKSDKTKFEYIENPYKNKLCNNLNDSFNDSIYVLYFNFYFDDIDASKQDNESIYHKKIIEYKNNLYFFIKDLYDIFDYDLIYSKLNIDEILYISNFFINKYDNSIIHIEKIAEILNYECNYKKYLGIYTEIKLNKLNEKYIDNEPTLNNIQFIDKVIFDNISKAISNGYRNIPELSFSEHNDILSTLIKKYVKCNNIILNESDSNSYLYKNEYIEIKNRIINLINKLFFNIQIDSHTFNGNVLNFICILYLSSNNKYFIKLSNTQMNINIIHSFLFLDILDDTTQIFTINDNFDYDGINSILETENEKNEKIEKIVNLILDGQILNIYEIFDKYIFQIEMTKEYKDKFLQINIDFSMANILIYLYRFGINKQNSIDYYFITNAPLIKRGDTTYIGMPPIYTDTQQLQKYTFFMINKRHNYSMELNFEIKDIVYIIKEDECFIHTNSLRHKLIFPKYIDKNNYPFLNCIPLNCPYMLYEYNNEYNLDIILDSQHFYNDRQSIFSTLYDPLYREFNIIGLKYNKIYKLKFSPSMIFPDLKYFNKNNHDALCKLYYGNFTLSESAQKKLNEDFSFNRNNENNIKINQTLNSIKDLFNQTITRSPETDEIFIKLIKSDKVGDKDKRIFFNEFITNRHDCTKLDKNICIENTQNKCKDFIIELDSIKKDILQKIKNIYDYNDFIMENLESFILLMKINIASKILRDLNDSVNCWDLQKYIIDIDNILSFDTIQIDFKYNYKIYDIIFLLQNPYFFSKSQIEKYINIKNDIIDHKTDLKLHQLMMGKGKTSVITPLLTFFIKLEKIKNPKDKTKMLKKIPTIITTSNLVEQTKNYLSIMELLLDFKFNVFNDIEAKKRWIENTDVSLSLNTLDKKIKIEEEINIIDEFDTHHNYLQSNLNFVKHEHLLINENVFKYIFNFVHNKIKNNIYFEDINESNLDTDLLRRDYSINITRFKQILNDTYTQSLNMIYNKDYGFNNEDTKSRICIPYIRKDIPAESSSFSNIILRLILTFYQYINYNLELQDIDFKIISKNYKLVEQLNIYDNIDDFYTLLEEINLGVIEIEKLFLHIQKKHNLIANKKIKQNITLKFLYEINKEKIKNTIVQINLSFQDIIYNTYDQLQIGYTGTTYLNLNTYEPSPNDKYVFRDKVPDYDESIEIILALNQYGKSTSNIQIHTISKSSSNRDIINKVIEILTSEGNIPRGLIDLANAFIKDKNRNIAQIIKSNLTNIKIIYITEDNKFFEYINDDIDKLYSGIHNDNFYYYDQGHTVGTDISQPPTGDVVVLIHKHTKLSEFAQGIFRFRKINRGTIIHILYIHEEGEDISSIDTENVYKLLKGNEDNFNENQKLGILYQLIKARARKQTKDYKEEGLKPDYYYAEQDINLDNICKKNISGLDSLIKSNEFYKTKYQFLFEENNIKKLYELIFNNGSQRQQNQAQAQDQAQAQAQAQAQEQAQAQAQAQAQEQAQAQTQAQARANYYFQDLLNKYEYFIRFPEHYECEMCNILNFVPFFLSEEEMKKKYTKIDLEGKKSIIKEITEIKINNKIIYISYNIIKPNKYDKYHELCFVEFDDKILIEKTHNAFQYYYDIFPVYDYAGKLINPKMFIKADSYKLNIHPVFVEIMGLINYYARNNIITENQQKNMESYINSITENAKILLLAHKFNFDKYNFNKYKNYYTYNNILNIILTKLCNYYITNRDFNDDNIFSHYKYISHFGNTSSVKNVLDKNTTENILTSLKALDYGFTKYNNFIKHVVKNKLIEKYDYFYDNNIYNEIKSYLFQQIIINYITSINNMHEHILDSIKITHNHAKYINKKYVKRFNYSSNKLIDYNFNIKISDEIIDLLKKLEEEEELKNRGNPLSVKLIHSSAIINKIKYIFYNIYISQSFYNNLYLNFLKEIYDLNFNESNTFNDTMNKLIVLYNHITNPQDEFVYSISTDTESNKKYKSILTNIDYHLKNNYIFGIKELFNKYTIHLNYNMNIQYNNNSTKDEIIHKLNHQATSETDKQVLLNNPTYKEIKSNIDLIIENLDEIFVIPTEKKTQTGGKNRLYKKKYIKYKQKYLQLKNMIKKY